MKSKFIKTLTSCSQSRRDDRATLHPEKGCKYRGICWNTTKK